MPTYTQTIGRFTLTTSTRPNSTEPLSELKFIGFVIVNCSYQIAERRRSQRQWLDSFTLQNRSTETAGTDNIIIAKYWLKGVSKP